MDFEHSREEVAVVFSVSLFEFVQFVLLDLPYVTPFRGPIILGDPLN